MVLNQKRPFTDDLASTMRMVDKISYVTGLPITGIISNTHLMDETTPEIVEQGYNQAVELSEAMGVPVRYLVAEKAMAGELDPEKYDCPIRPIERYILPPFAKTPPGRKPLRKVI